MFIRATLNQLSLAGLNPHGNSDTHTLRCHQTWQGTSSIYSCFSRFSLCLMTGPTESLREGRRLLDAELLKVPDFLYSEVCVCVKHKIEHNDSYAYRNIIIDIYIYILIYIYI